MIVSTFRYEAPDSTAAAVGLLAAQGGVPLAGGQSLLVDMKLGDAAPSLLVDLGRIDSLRGVSRLPDGTIRIGATTSLADLAADAAVPSVLAEAARSVADPQVRHQATVGGNIVTAGRGTSLPPVLMALGATVRVAAPGGDRAMTIGEYLSEPESQLITSVDVPPAADDEACVAERFSARPARLPLLMAAVWMRGGPGGPVSACRVAVSTPTAGPRALPEAERELVAAGSPAEAVQRAADAISGTPFAADEHASAEYYAHLAATVVSRCARFAFVQLIGNE